VLKVRIIAYIEERVKLEMEREGITRAEALHLLKKDDEERRKWSQELYETDPWDPSLYDLVLQIRKATVDDAVDVICHMAALKAFQATKESKTAMEDLVLTAEAKAALIAMYHVTEISAQDGIVFVRTKATLHQQSPLSNDIEKIVKEIPGVKDVRIDFEPIVPLS
jgi:hypothetical protein